MVKITPSKSFIKQIKHLSKDYKIALEKQIRKIIDNPQIGKPLRYKRGERSLYVKPFRFVYSIKNDEIILLKF